MKIVERVLGRGIRELVDVDSMHFGFVPVRGATDALFVVRRIQKEYGDRKMYVCFVDIGGRWKEFQEGWWGGQ